MEFIGAYAHERAAAVIPEYEGVVLSGIVGVAVINESCESGGVGHVQNIG